MRCFFDVEFVQRWSGTTDFYSVGMVREDGRELYRVSSECTLRKANRWFKENVVPQTRDEPKYCHLSIRLALQEFLEGVTMLVTREGGQDGDVLRQIIDEHPPISDLQVLWSALGRPSLPERVGAHHALDDARWHKTMFDSLAPQALEHVQYVWGDGLVQAKIKPRYSKGFKKQLLQARTLIHESQFTITA